MCGIAGAIGRHGSAQAIERMNAVQRTRGPDDCGVWHADGAWLGHTRLSILDLSAAGRQPMELDEFVLSFNGEIYNFRDLRRSLPGPFHSESDSEVLLQLYRRDGPRCVESLRGMFAFAIWDRRRRTLFAARDHLGIKPFHYRADAESIEFASDLGALAAIGRPTLDKSAIVDYVTHGYVPTPKSIYAGHAKLPAAHTLWWQAGRLELRRYWAPDPSVRVARLDEACATLDGLLREVVPEQLVADVPIGVFLSGGIDSATIAAYAGRVKTFTLGFEDAGKSEAEAARRVAAHLGTEHAEATAGAGDLRLAVDTVARTYGEPFGDSAAWSAWLVSRLARREVTVALSGEGGDELFGGYERYWEAAGPAQRWQARALRAIAAPCSALGRSAYRRSADGVEAATARLFGIVGPAADALLHPDLVATDYDRLWQYRAHWRPELPPLVAVRWLELHTALADGLLTKVDQASMAWALEVRPPLLDPRIVEFAFTLDPALLVDRTRGQGKRVLRELIAPRLPAGHLDRPKQGFGLPVRRWLKQDRAFVADNLRWLVDAGILRRVPPPGFDRTWQLLVLARWLRLRA